MKDVERPDQGLIQEIRWELRGAIRKNRGTTVYTGLVPPFFLN